MHSDDFLTEARFLGTGTSLGVPVIGCDCPVCLSRDPRDSRLRSSFFVRTGDVNIIIDTGPDFRQQMLRAGIRHIDAILITHAHKDHTAGLDDIRAYNYLQSKAMDIYGYPEVISSLKEEFSYAFSPDPYPGVPQMNLHPIDVDAFYVKGVRIQPIKVLHGKMPVSGFRIGDLVYITDASSIPREAYPLFEGCKILIINALRLRPHHSHFNLEQALEMASAINAERTFLTHVSHYLGLYESVNKQLPDGVELGYDGLEVISN